MNAAAELIAYHIEAKTPLRRLANSVRWFEAMAKTANTSDRIALRAKAQRMRVVISNVYAHRDIAGEYEEQPIAA
jgi:hypothetical protein